MAEDDKILKTGDLRVKRDASGNRYMKYVDEDERHGVRPEDQWEDVDLKVRQFFGYDTWEEYSADNQSDLTRNVQRDEDGKVVAAPTLWPFHVAYTLEEFKENLDGDKYAVVGVPKNPELQKRTGVALAIKIAQARREYFKPGGALDRGMKNPRETLDNQELIDRAKKNLDFDSAFNAKLANKAVQHPETIQTKRETGHELYWAENIGNYRDVASREDMTKVFGFPLLTEPKRVDTGALQKNEEGKILLEKSSPSMKSALKLDRGEVAPAYGSKYQVVEKTGLVILDFSENTKDIKDQLRGEDLRLYYVLEPKRPSELIGDTSIQDGKLWGEIVSAVRKIKNIKVMLHDEEGKKSSINPKNIKELLTKYSFLRGTFHRGAFGEKYFSAVPDPAALAMKKISAAYGVPYNQEKGDMFEGTDILEAAQKTLEYHKKLRTNPMFVEYAGEQKATEEEWAWFGLQLIDFTGVLSIPDLVESYNRFGTNKSLSNFGNLSLNFLAVLPIASVIVKGGYRAYKGVGKSFISADPQNVKELNRIKAEFYKRIDEAPRAGKGTRQHQIYKIASEEFLNGPVIEGSLKRIKDKIDNITKKYENLAGKDPVAAAEKITKAIDKIVDQELNIVNKSLKRLENVSKRYGNSVTSSTRDALGQVELALKNHVSALNNMRRQATKVFADLKIQKATEAVLTTESIPGADWAKLVDFFNAQGKGKIDELLKDKKILKALKKLGIQDDSIKALSRITRKMDDPAKLLDDLKVLTKSGARYLLKVIDKAIKVAAAISKIIKKGVEVQGTFDIPDAPVTEVDFLLLPSTWYQGTVLTEGEILVRERLMIKGPARAAEPTRPEKKELEVTKLPEPEDAAAPEPQGGAPPEETETGQAEPGQEIQDKFENYPWSKDNPYTAVDDDGKRREVSNQARAWEAAMKKSKFDKHFGDNPPGVEDFKAGGIRWYNPNQDTNSQAVEDIQADLMKKWSLRRPRNPSWLDVTNVAIAIDALDGNGYDKEKLITKALDLKEQDKSTYEIITTLGEEAPSMTADGMPGGGRVNPGRTGPDVAPAAGEEQPEDETPEITKNKKLAEENEVGKWTPALFGAEKFDQQLVDNIVALQKQLGFEGDEIDGLAGEGTLTALYRLLNRKYKFNDDQLKKFKEEIANGKTSEEAAKSVIDSDESLSERSLAAIEKQMSTSPDKKPTRSPLKQFEGTGNVKIIDPRTAFAHPKIHKWLSGLEGSWVVGDISLPFGGGSHPTSTKESRSRDYEGTSFSYNKVRFNHTRHKFGTHVDFQIPLKQGGFNAWDTKVDAEEIDFEKVLNLLEQAKASGLKFSVVMDAEHIEKLKEEFGEQLRGISLIKNDSHRDHIHIQFPPSQKNLRANKRHFLSFDWFEAEAKTIIEKNKGTARKENWKPVLFGSKTFDTNLVQNIWKFQEYTGLFPDGVAGKRTVKRLKYLITKNKQLAKKYKWEPKDFGAEKFDINLIYKIFEYQSKNNLKADGKAGKGTIKSKSARANISENKILEFLFKFTDEVENELV